ncbi:hypothetical protein [Nocardiopsis sp. JB363]|uniref:hypothetical protein n=1 Tax=Nocardiopsis sp. JB363 TaxID=1434837 RepID=UPI00097A704C|nr:hypothetical protein [Nocardiopsis sp. JB363]SIO84624.1 hypothetical protein BQ8420_02850 [Nocardiopsis sp. JB363]
MTDTTTVPVLVPDLDGDLTRTVAALEVWARALDEAQIDDLLGMEAADLVSPLGRLFDVVAPLEVDESIEQMAAEDGHPRRYGDRMFAPDGRYEYTPLHPARMDSADIEVLRRATGLVSQIQTDPHNELAGVLEDLAPLFAAEMDRAGQEVGHLEPLHALDRILAVLGLTGHDPDRERLHGLLVALPSTVRPERDDKVDRILTSEMEELFQEVSAQIVRAWYPPAEQDLQTWARL